MSINGIIFGGDVWAQITGKLEPITLTGGKRMRESDYQFFIASCKSPKPLDIDAYELRKALDTIAKHCKRTRCGDCIFTENNKVWCKLRWVTPEDYDKIEVEDDTGRAEEGSESGGV